MQSASNRYMMLKRAANGGQTKLSLSGQVAGTLEPRGLHTTYGRSEGLLDASPRAALDTVTPSCHLCCWPCALGSDIPLLPSPASVGWTLLVPLPLPLLLLAPPSSRLMRQLGSLWPWLLLVWLTAACKERDQLIAIKH